MAENPFADDKLNRQPDAVLLTQLITRNPRPSVISIDAPWGGGKSTFVKMWAGLLRAAGHPVVVYNAWETDFVEDPLVAFIGELDEALAAYRSVTGKDSRLQHNWERLKALGLGVIRSTGPLAVRIATQGMFDVQGVRDALGFVANSEDAIGDYVSKITEQRLAAYGKEKAAVLAFRQTLESVAAELAQQPGIAAPIIVFVDELDRCRPSFAIALLERVKHLFAVDGVVFVLAQDREQLAHTVRAIYGQGFAAEGYLRRFIDFDYRLPAATGKTFTEFLSERHNLIDVYRTNTVSGDEYDSAILHFSKLAEIFQLSLRDQEQAFQRILLALKSAESPKHYLFTNLMVFLGVLRWGSPQLYHRYMSGRAKVNEVIADVRERQGGAKYLLSHAGQVTQAYLLISARTGSGADEYFRQLKRTAEASVALEDEKKEATGILRLSDAFLRTGGDYALKAALTRLERINMQIDTLGDW